MDWILLKTDDTPREEKTGIDWLDKVLELAAEIITREVQVILKESRNDTILQSKREVGSLQHRSPRYTWSR